jgi:heme-degrading monooxygenase HmoA
MSSSSSSSSLSIDLEKDPQLRFRIDSFHVPASARAEFEAAMHRNLTFLETLPGFRSHMVFEQASNTSKFNIVTIAVWESPEAIAAAGEQVRAYYQRIGFDMRAMIQQWDVEAEIGVYQAPPHLQ